MNSNDDIVTRLRQFVRQCNHGWNLGNDWYPAPTECLSCVRQRDAADEIEKLRAEVNTMACAQGGWGQVGRLKAENELLRQVGDKIAMHLDAFFGMLEPASNEIAEVLKEWKDVRYG